MAETDKVMDLEFKWGKKRGVGGKRKEVRFYESFTYDGVEYSLYDCVYMHKEGEPEPYIGKLIKIWEIADKTKKVKVQWFFRPSEILRWLGDEMTLENEIFLATGEGLGLANVNPLDKSKWFRTRPLEERLQDEHEKGTLILLQNLDPEYTSGEVQDIIRHAFAESCTAKMVQRTSISSPHSGQAIVIFKTREATVKIIKRLSEECLMLPNGRPLVGSTGLPLNFPGKQSAYYGHLVMDNKLQSQREMKDAVSTSHCSQPNTIEYDMAMEWCLLQSRSDSWWKMLYKQQGQELRKLKANLKSK